jgi:hypothetical protein
MCSYRNGRIASRRRLDRPAWTIQLLVIVASVLWAMAAMAQQTLSLPATGSLGNSGSFQGCNTTNPLCWPFQGGGPYNAGIAAVTNWTNSSSGGLNTAVVGTSYSTGTTIGAGVTGNSIALGSGNPIAQAGNFIATCGATGTTQACLGTETQVEMVGTGNGIGSIIEFGDDAAPGHGGNNYMLFRYLGTGPGGTVNPANAPNSVFNIVSGTSYPFNPLSATGAILEITGPGFATQRGLDLRNGSFSSFALAANAPVRLYGNGVMFLPPEGLSVGRPVGALSLDANPALALGNQVQATAQAPVTLARFYGWTGSSWNPVGAITYDGMIHYNGGSDYRLKQDVSPLEGALDRVAHLRPVRFAFKTDPGKRVDGFLAHEVATVVPEAVTGEKDGPEMQGMDAAKLVPLLTAAIKELEARVKVLEARLAH